MEKKVYQYLLFDMDNTLYDFNEAERQAFQQLCQRYGISYSEELLRFYHQVNDGLWKRLEKGEITQKQLQPKRFEEICRYVGKKGLCHGEMNDVYRGFLAECGVMIPGALEICRKLSETFTLCLVTNGVSKTQRGRLRGAKLMEYVSGVFISEEIGFHKPQKEFFDYVLKQMEAKADNALVIGDSVSSDILGGIQAGIDTCLYDPKKKGYPSDIIPTYSINRLEELLEILY